MKFIKTTNPTDLELAGVTTELDIVDGAIRSITITDANGKFYRAVLGDYNVSVQIPAPPKMVTRYSLKGTVLSLPVDLQFLSHADAQKVMDGYQRNASPDHVNLSIGEIEVAEDQDRADQVADFYTDLPF